LKSSSGKEFAMRQSNRHGLLLIAIGLCSCTIQASQDEATKKIDQKSVVVYVETSVILEVEAKGPTIKEVVNENDMVLRVSAVPARTSLMLTGVKPGMCQLNLTLADGKKLSYSVEVRRRITLPVGVTHVVTVAVDVAKLQNENDKVARIETVAEGPHRLKVQALSIGKSICTITSKDGKQEAYDILVSKPDLVITVGEKQVFRHDEMLRSVLVEQEDVITVEPVTQRGEVPPVGRLRRGDGVWVYGGPRTLVFTGQFSGKLLLQGHRPGVVAMTLFDENGMRKTINVGVVPKR
jgi:hypothetical protein